MVAQKWAALSEDNRKEWAMKAEAACSAAIQVGVATSRRPCEEETLSLSFSPQDLTPPQPAVMGMETQRPLNPLLGPDLSSEESLIEKTTLAIQEKVLLEPTTAAWDKIVCWSRASIL